MNPNSPAFPLGIESGYEPDKGLLKREYFAALAMQGLLANPHSYGCSAATIAADSVKNADALIAELSKE
jgi:hypothetical protein